MKKRKNKWMLVLVVILFILVLGTFIIAYKHISSIKFQGEKVIKHPVYVEVDTSSVGINANPGVLNYGRMGPGNSGIRYLDIKNTRRFREKITFAFEGDVAGWMRPEKNNFVLGPGKEIKKMELVLHVPANTSKGNYTGTAIVTFKRIGIR